MFAVSRIVFDCSGVLSDDREPVYQANIKLARHYGKEFAPRETWQSMASNCVGAMKAIGVSAPAEEIYPKFMRYYKEAVDAGIRPVIYPDVVRTLDELVKRGKRLSVVSSHPHASLLEDLDGISHYFDHISGEHNGHMEKAGAIRSLDAQAYVGDMTFDLQAAREAGVIAVGCATGYHSREQLEAMDHDLIIGSLFELLNHV